MFACSPVIIKKENVKVFYTAALILTVSMILVKLIGAMFKIPLTWILQKKVWDILIQRITFTVLSIVWRLPDFPLPCKNGF